MSILDSTAHSSTATHGYYAWTDTLKGVYYGAGSVQTALPTLLDLLDGHKALIVTGKSLYTKTEVVKKVEAILKSKNAYGGTFWEIGEHSPIAGIRNGATKFKEAGCDIIVAVGGGSPVDATKAIIYYLQQETKGPFVKQIAIPTTLSAAEYTIGAGYTNEDGVKVAVSDQQLAPSGIILDSELTLDTPERLWLSTGIRALDHAVENLYRPLIPPPMKALCYVALRDLFTYLPKSKADPSNVTYRTKLQLASWMSLWPIKLQKYSALGLSHALGHKLGARYSIGHGITSCLTLAPTVHYKATSASEEDKQWLSDALFYLRIPTTGSLESDVHTLADAIDKLVAELGLKTNLEEQNVPRADAESIAAQAIGGKDGPEYPHVVDLVKSLWPSATSA
ncbi:alcohol dehydrogenase IV [Sistotremastrum niveocremeum HHB9708]|uniref:Alcohol dehydrogenase IV n=1 Tax=Sistotremastrum niveocremeum HHB9708 TaxID=1314777 RepID=A0A164MPK7_9AGAM|nr:alcohol dehydrogenase IV [Sistotremastrum niveocremeum HHB9708]